MLRQQPRLFPFLVTPPAAGAEFQLTPKGQGGWLVQSIAYTLTTSVAVANRLPALVVSDGTTPFMRFEAPAAIPASIAARFQAYEGAFPTVGSGGLVTLSWPGRGVWLPQGYTLTSATAAIDIADQYSAIVAYVLEIPSGPDWYGFPFQLIHSEDSDD
jgi:hypothetical protein